jgi:hypothetical protein
MLSVALIAVCWLAFFDQATTAFPKVLTAGQVYDKVVQHVFVQQVMRKVNTINNQIMKHKYGSAIDYQDK